MTVQVPIRVDYKATSLGDAMMRQVHPVWVWTAGNLAAFKKARQNYDRFQSRTAAAIKWSLREEPSRADSIGKCVAL
jgi:hypothetical protein